MKISKSADQKENTENGGAVSRFLHYLLSNKRLYCAVILAFIGIVLLIIGNIDISDEKRTDTGEYPDLNGKYDMIEYSEYIEEKIEKLCLKIDGVSKVSVIVVLENGFEYVYAQNIRSENNSNSYYESSEYLLTEVDGNENVVYITGKSPKISGIGIVYSGDEDESIRLEIINLISAAFDVKKSRIYVGK